MKLFKSNVNELSSNEFDREIKIMKDGEQITMKQNELKKYLADLFEGGRTLSSVEKKLIKDGLEGGQWERRKEIIKILENIKTNDEPAFDRAA